MALTNGWRTILVFTGIALALLGRWGLLHAEEHRDMAGGYSSWLAPRTRKVLFGFNIVGGLALAVVALGA
ncbi:MAG: hypothetical protein ACRD0G_01865 [Acidimicrobiales bacterium]